VAPRSFCPALVAPTPLPSRCRLSHSVLNFHPPGRSILCSMSIDSNPTTLHQHHSDNGHQQNHHLCLSMARNSTLSRLSWSTEDTTTAESTFFNGKDGHGRIGHGHQRASCHTARRSSPSTSATMASGLEGFFFRRERCNRLGLSLLIR